MVFTLGIGFFINVGHVFNSMVGFWPNICIYNYGGENINALALHPT